MYIARNGILLFNNAYKTKIMLFTLSNKPEQFYVYYDEILLENVPDFICLGVNISSNGIFF